MIILSNQTISKEYLPKIIPLILFQTHIRSVSRDDRNLSWWLCLSKHGISQPQPNPRAKDKEQWTFQATRLVRNWWELNNPEPLQTVDWGLGYWILFFIVFKNSIFAQMTFCCRSYLDFFLLSHSLRICWGTFS